MDLTVSLPGRERVVPGLLPTKKGRRPGQVGGGVLVGVTFCHSLPGADPPRFLPKKGKESSTPREKKK